LTSGSARRWTQTSRVRLHRVAEALSRSERASFLGGAVEGRKEDGVVFRLRMTCTRFKLLHAWQGLYTVRKPSNLDDADTTRFNPGMFILVLSVLHRGNSLRGAGEEGSSKIPMQDCALVRQASARHSDFSGHAAPEDPSQATVITLSCPAEPCCVARDEQWISTKL